MFDDFPWIKFIVLCVPLIALMWWMAPSMKWKLLFTLAVPIGVGLALAGRSMKGITPWKGDLADITVYGENPLKGLGYWKIRRKQHRDPRGHFTPLNLPFTIPPPECDFEVFIQQEFYKFFVYLLN